MKNIGTPYMYVLKDEKWNNGMPTLPIGHSSLINAINNGSDFLILDLIWNS